MKYLLAIGWLFSSFLHAQSSFQDSFDPIDISLQDFSIPRHRKISARYDISQATKQDAHNLEFGQGAVSFSWIEPLNACSQIEISAGYLHYLYRWKPSGLSSQERFQNGFVSLGMHTCTNPGWEWFGEVLAQSDLDREMKNSTLVFFSGYGSYAWSSSLSLAAGAIFRKGIHDQKAWPIIGFTYTHPCFDLNLIFPLDISAHYKIGYGFSLYTAARFFNNRHRLGPSEEIYPGGYMEYRNYGGEVGLTFAQDPYLSIDFHIGCLANAQVTAGPKAQVEWAYSSYGASGYAGGQASFRF